jgi:cellobiose-specific phosphotransferase system component IIC
MDILHWMDTGLRAVAAGFFALIPGTTVWAVMIGIYLLIRWIVRSRAHGSVGVGGQSH